MAQKAEVFRHARLAATVLAVLAFAGILYGFLYGMGFLVWDRLSEARWPWWAYVLSLPLAVVASPWWLARLGTVDAI